MINGLVDALKSINNTTYEINLAINSLNYARNFLLTYTEINNRLNQLHNGLWKFETNVLIIYNYVHFLNNKIVAPTLIHPVDLRRILHNIWIVIPKYLSLLNNPNPNIWSFWGFLKVHPLIFNVTLIISIVVPLVDNTFPLQLC